MRKPSQSQSTDTMPATSVNVSFSEPTLRFIEPKLRKQGAVAKVTHGFFGSFDPGGGGGGLM
jgi:hypothetical protein